MKNRLIILIITISFNIKPVNFIAKTYFKISSDEKKAEQLNNAIKFGVEHRLKTKDLEELIELTPKNVIIETDSLNRLLSSACRNNNIEIIKFAIEKGANVNSRTEGFSTPLLEASMALFKQRLPNTEILDFLIKNSATTENFNENNHYDKRAKNLIIDNLQLTNTSTYKIFTDFVNKNKKAFEDININTVKNLSTTEKIAKQAGQYLLRRFGF
jgi:hypothetical protein